MSLPLEDAYRPGSPVSDFSDDTDSDTSLPDTSYLASRLSIPTSLAPLKRHQALLKEANSIEKMFAEKDGKVRAASECEAVFESEKKRLSELQLSLQEASQNYEEIKKQVEDEPLGLQALPKSLIDSLRVSEKQAMIASELFRAQRQTVAREERVYLHAQHEANVAEASVERFADIVGDLRKVSEMEVAKRTKQVKKIKRKEVVSAKRLEKRQRDRVKVSAGAYTNAIHTLDPHAQHVSDELTLLPFFRIITPGVQQEAEGEQRLGRGPERNGTSAPQDVSQTNHSNEQGNQREQEVHGGGPSGGT